MPIVKGLVLRGWDSLYPTLARVMKVSPKTYRVLKLEVTPTGEIKERWTSRWWRRDCVPVTEAMLKLLRDLAGLNELYRQKARALDEEHKEYGKPLVRAIQEEIKEARASFDSARTVAEPGTNIPDAPS